MKFLVLCRTLVEPRSCLSGVVKKNGRMTRLWEQIGGIVTQTECHC